MLRLLLFFMLRLFKTGRTFSRPPTPLTLFFTQPLPSLPFPHFPLPRRPLFSTLNLSSPPPHTPFPVYPSPYFQIADISADRRTLETACKIVPEISLSSSSPFPPPTPLRLPNVFLFHSNTSLFSIFISTFYQGHLRATAKFELFSPVANMEEVRLEGPIPVQCTQSRLRNRMWTKEYISLLERTAPSFVFCGKHSPNLSPLCLQ